MTFEQKTNTIPQTKWITISSNNKTIPFKKKKNKNRMIYIIKTYFPKCWSHIISESASHNHNIGLSWAGPKDDAIPVQIVPAGPGVYHLNRASGQPISHGPHGPCSGPIHEWINLWYCVLCHFVQACIDRKRSWASMVWRSRWLKPRLRGHVWSKVELWDESKASFEAVCLGIRAAIWSLHQLRESLYFLWEKELEALGERVLRYL